MPVVDCIKNLGEFEALKSDWERVYNADPQAHIFVSWAWLHGFFEVTRYQWCVLAFSPDAETPYVSFFTITVEHRTPAQDIVLRLGGAPLADYSGFVSLPDYEEQAIAVFSYYVKKYMEWDLFILKDVMDPRFDLFLNTFTEKQFHVQEVNRILCPYILLPATWDQYLEDCIGSEMRRNIKRKTRKIEALNGFRFSNVSMDNFDYQVDAMFTLWQYRWGPRPEEYRAIFRRCSENNALWMGIIWDGEIPIAGLTSFIDPIKKALFDFITGFHPQYAKLSPGLVIHAYCIQYAIENGYRIYDYLRGGEEHKFDFGAIERFNRSSQIYQKSLKRAVEKGLYRFSSGLRKAIYP